MTPCPECSSDEVYQTVREVDSTTIGGGLLPGLSGSMFASAQLRLVLCGDCGYVRLFAETDALEKLSGAKQWVRVEK